MPPDAHLFTDVNYLLSESVARRRQICKPANVGGGDYPSRSGPGDEPGGRIAAGDTAESRGRRRQASRAEMFRMSACMWERRPSQRHGLHTLT